MSAEITAQQLREWLYDGAELALLDVREPGQMILAHILFSAPLPYSRFEAGLAKLAPNPAVRMVLCDAGDGIAARAAGQAVAMGYANVFTLAGGVQSWADAGHTLYQGVNVPSKAFGELVEHAADTPRLPCAKIAEMQRDGTDMVIVDGRPLEEYAKMSIPGAECCPNGELALRAPSFAPNPETTIIVNCAGRTRSIIGAQTLIDMGVPNPVYAMENGTQGWTLAGMKLDTGRNGALPQVPGSLSQQQANAQALAAEHGVERVDVACLQGWLNGPACTVFLLDVRTAAERSEDSASRRSMMHACGVVHAPGGQLVQATDQWIGVRNAHVVVLDTEAVRAPVTAAWLRRIGHKAAVLDGGLDSLSGVDPVQEVTPWSPDAVPDISSKALSVRIGDGGVTLLDLRSSAAFREVHIAGAIWTIRPRLPKLTGAVVMVGNDDVTASLVAKDLRSSGVTNIARLGEGPDAWREADLDVERTPDLPSDADRIDFQSFTAGRHDGDEAASRQYLKWEIELVDQLDADERAVFRV